MGKYTGVNRKAPKPISPKKRLQKKRSPKITLLDVISYNNIFKMISGVKNSGISKEFRDKYKSEKIVILQKIISKISKDIKKEEMNISELKKQVGVLKNKNGNSLELLYYLGNSNKNINNVIKDYNKLILDKTKRVKNLKLDLKSIKKLVNT